MGQMKGKASIEFEHPPVIISAGSVVGKKEGEGPLGKPVRRGGTGRYVWYG